ncbi:hypothetical protein AVEN_146913-1 [Araneus ventricosus]|uniref:Uncharacterized protein n=1 Tax=Araneus ventricosus TaxID=182803 RepID=A0A4Y2TAT4_ARAVE|nr:hypothetical protein AVEN_145512-1 [Araneus ventricosus]GBN97758.1 hypothetical protein AVEN_146913-1 [Araneus ventricosus]
MSRKWHFSDNPHKSFPFENDAHVPPTSRLEYVSEVKTQFLRENEGSTLTSQQKNTLNVILNGNEVFRLHGEPTPYVEHHIADIVNDLTSVIENNNFVSEITPDLKRFSELSSEIRDKFKKKQDRRKQQFDRRRRPLYFSSGDKVWVTTHPVSKAHSKITAKFVPKRDGPYLILTQKSPKTYVVSRLDSPDEPLGTCHVSALHPVQSRDTQPGSPIKKRERPPKTRTTSPPTGVRSRIKRHAPSRRAQQDSPGSSSGRRRN